MPNVVITSDANKIKIVSNGLIKGFDTAAFRITDLASVESHTTPKGTFITMRFDDGEEVSFDHTEARGPKVDTVNEVSVSSNTDLCEKLEALIKA